MKAQTASHAARGFDTVTNITKHAADLAADGFDFAIRYWPALASDELHAILDASLALMLVSYGGHFPLGLPHRAVEHADTMLTKLDALGIPQGSTLWYDLEGIEHERSAADIIDPLNAWADHVAQHGHVPGLYVGAQPRLTSMQLQKLHFVRYWKGLSRLIDPDGHITEPAVGWCCYQLFPTVHRNGVDIDVDVVQHDFRGRLPTWIVA